MGTLLVLLVLHGYYGFTPLVVYVETINLWNLDGKFSLKVVSACNLNVSKDASVSLLVMFRTGPFVD